jgi:hypothetical protein
MQLIKLAVLPLALALGAAISTANALDPKSEPKGILPDASQQALWNAYKSAKECFQHPNYDPGVPQNVPTLSVPQLGDHPWVTPFPAVKGSPTCVTGPGSLRIPATVATVHLDERYGERQTEVDVAETWFRQLTTYYRYTGDPVAAQLLHQAVLQWAKEKGLSSGIHVRWGHKPVDYQMMSAVFSILNAAAAVAPSFSAEERQVIGPWLNALVKESAASVWKDREDDKVFMHAYMGLIWGMMVGDDRPVQQAIDIFKLAIHDMRPDGSWPIDSQRGGMGLNYNSTSTSHLVMIATALKEARNADLFSYSVDGRSIPNAVEFVVEGIENPALNRKYAIACPGGGDRWGSIDAPSLAYAQDHIGYLIAYANQFPDQDVSKRIVARYGSKEALDAEESGGAPACLFASTGGEVNLPPLSMPSAPPALPKQQIQVSAKEELAHNEGHATNINSLLSASIAHAARGRDSLQFNVVGEFDYETKAPTQLAFMINDNLGKTPPKALAACNTPVRVWDDGGTRALIVFDISGRTLTPDSRTACTIKALPANAAFTAQFLVDHFRDITIGMVNSGAADSVKNDALKILLNEVAIGDLKFGAT